MTETESCNEHECDACGALFPFGRQSNGTRSVIESLITNLHYQLHITENGN